MSLSLDDADPEVEDSPSLLTRVSNILLGDPRKAPRRILTLIVLALFGFIALGVWLLINSKIDTSGSSAPVVGPVLSILTSVWLIPVLALWCTRQWVLFRRGRKAKQAAGVTGWTVGTIKQLCEEIKTTDGCTRIIASTGDSREEIAQRIDAALAGEYDDDTVSFWDFDDDDSDGETATDAVDESDDRTRREQLLDRQAELADEYNRKTERIESLLNDALEGEIDPTKLFQADGRASPYELMDDGAREAVDEAEQLIDECEAIEQELEDIRAELEELAAIVDDVADGIENAQALESELLEAGYDHTEWTTGDESRSRWSRLLGLPKRLLGFLAGLVSRGSSDEGDADDENNVPEEYQIPWRVRFKEEIKHLWLDLQSGFRTGDAVIKFGVPALVTFVLQLFLVGLWTTLPVYGLILSTSTVFGLAWFWVSKRRQQRRLRRYRKSSSGGYWIDCAGQFKTAETADVTAYMGFIGGRRYASYDRREFIRKTSRTMHQHVSDECVAPSDLEHYARCLQHMEPNLKGHRDNILKPEIGRDLEQTVRDSEDELIPKAELAWSVIEQPTTSRIESRIGHDPEHVRDQYRTLVEDLHVLDEHDVDFVDANGDEQTITLVFPADKRRLPDVSERHSQFSDRFTDKKGDPVYELPEVDPRDSLLGFVPTPREAALFNGADPGEIALAGGD